MSASNPQDDAERIRLKRLAKLQSAPSASTSTTPPPSAPQPKPKPVTVQKRPAEVQSTPSPIPLKKKIPVIHLDHQSWESEAVQDILKVTLSKEVAETSEWEIVWLKHLAEEYEAETPNAPRPIPLSAEIADRLLIARLELDPQTMSDDLEYLSVIASLPPQETTFEFLVGCWKRLNITRHALLRKGYPRVETQRAIDILEKLRDLIISYAGLTLQEPEMFPQPSGRAVGASELAVPLLSLSSFSPLFAPTAASSTLTSSDIDLFLHDLARRFEPDNEIDGILGPVMCHLCFHESLFRPEGLAGGDAGWRGVIAGIEALVSVKSIAIMMTRLPEWIPMDASAAAFENTSLLGPLLRLGVFEREWPSIAQTYFTKPRDRSPADIDSATASLRGTLKSLQNSLFQIFNALVRASPESREAVLQYFSRVVELNEKRAGMQVDWETVSTDSFVVNLQLILLRFCEPFMDANYSKMERIDSSYYAHSTRINLKEETLINATTDEGEKWRQQNQAPDGPPPNFISEVFFLTLALNHYGYQKTINSFEDLGKHLNEMQTQLDMLEGDGSWRNTPFQARTEAAINAVKAEQDKIETQQLAYVAQLRDPELVFRSMSFANFVSTWLIRLVDPKKTHPSPPVELPLPKQVPDIFRVLPQYLVEDVIDYQSFVIQQSPESLELSGKVEILMWSLTFLTSTWYIQNPFLKAKIADVLFYGSFNWGGRRNALGSTLNSHPMALKHLMSALMHFYIEVEQTGASSQFYDKFNSRRNLSHIFKVIWDNPAHREALKTETRTNMEKFVRFVNLMINDVTYLLDESLSELAKIHELETEIARPDFATQPPQYRREREQNLRQLERHASGYTQLGNTTVQLLKDFTAETKEPFMVPEIVNKLAAMLDYNLDALAGPRCQNLVLKSPEKYKFRPKQLLADVLQVFLNLTDQAEFVRAVADDGRSYRKELFERAAGIARKRSLKSETEIEQLRLFVVKVEETKATMEAEDDLGEIPDEFLDPLMYTIMRDPVILPSSHAVIDRSTIKAHLLSDTKDPFNRAPLSLEDVTPDVDLKARIDAFLAERKNKNTALDKPSEEIVHMDVDSV